jgi:hypothetical protein
MIIIIFGKSQIWDKNCWEVRQAEDAVYTNLIRAFWASQMRSGGLRLIEKRFELPGRHKPFATHINCICIDLKELCFS